MLGLRRTCVRNVSGRIGNSIQVTRDSWSMRDAAVRIGNSHMHGVPDTGPRQCAWKASRLSAWFVVLRVVGSSLPEDWVFLLERMPGPWRKWPVGKEVQLSLSQAAFEWLQGKRESYEGFC